MGEFTGLTFLGAGGMGVVYRAEKAGQPYVLKEVSQANPQGLLALTQERGLLERLKHPGVVRYHSIFEESGYYYLVLEYIEGIPLSELPYTPNEDQVRDWGGQLCNILSYLHDQDPPVIYRDLKPENVLLQGNRVRLIDFGIARLKKGDRDSDTQMMGTVGTASPEHYGTAETDERSDIYTVGASLYQLLARGRQKPPSAAFQFVPIRQINPDVSEDMERILQKCTAFSPEDRYCNIEELEIALLGKENRTSPVPIGEAPLTRPRPTRKTWIALGLLLLAILGGSAFFAQRSPSPEPDRGLEGPLFGARGPDITLGDDVGLFRLAGSMTVSAEERAKIISERLNTLYHSRCMKCGRMKLGSQDLLVGHYVNGNLDEVVLFYAHSDDGMVTDGPMLLATVDQATAQAAQASTPRYAAGHWRDLMRDLIELSRGGQPAYSALGEEIRVQLENGRKAGNDAVQEWLGTLSSGQAARLREAYLKVLPDRPVQRDQFRPVGNFQPLRG